MTLLDRDITTYEMYPEIESIKVYIEKSLTEQGKKSFVEHALTMYTFLLEPGTYTSSQFAHIIRAYYDNSQAWVIAQIVEDSGLTFEKDVFGGTRAYTPEQAKEHYNR